MHTKRKPAHQADHLSQLQHTVTPGMKRRRTTVYCPQFFDSTVKLAAVCPETALMYAVLENAFLSFHKQFESGQWF